VASTVPATEAVVNVARAWGPRTSDISRPKGGGFRTIRMRWRASVLATVVGSLAVAATGRAADQLVLGDAFVLVNPGGA
jgi:glycerol uptake facilitator-like aquaporin